MKTNPSLSARTRLPLRGVPSGLTQRAATRSLGAGMALLLIAACGPPLKPPIGPAPEPPAEALVVVGDGALAGGHFGPAGGILKLGPPGPSIEIPAGMPGAGGLSVSLEAQSSADLPDVAGRIGTPFRATPTLSPPSGKWIVVRSIEVERVPPECAPPALHLALEVASAEPGPALRWRYESAEWEHGRAVATLSELPPARSVFVCKTKP
jgi:hypothetical protein